MLRFRTLGRQNGLLLHEPHAVGSSERGTGLRDICSFEERAVDLRRPKPTPAKDLSARLAGINSVTITYSPGESQPLLPINKNEKQKYVVFYQNI